MNEESDCFLRGFHSFFFGRFLLYFFCSISNRREDTAITLIPSVSDINENFNCCVSLSAEMGKIYLHELEQTWYPFPEVWESVPFDE